MWPSVVVTNQLTTGNGDFIVLVAVVIYQSCTSNRRFSLADDEVIIAKNNRNYKT